MVLGRLVPIACSRATGLSEHGVGFFTRPPYRGASRFKVFGFMNRWLKSPFAVRTGKMATVELSVAFADFVPVDQAAIRN